MVGNDDGERFVPVVEFDGVRVFAGDCREVLKSLPDCSVDSIVTDPPYGLSNTTPELVNVTLGKWLNGERDFIPDGKGFMGKDWDAFVPPPAVWDECLRVLKPGGHLLAFFGSRTMDLGQLSIRLAGFEIRDNVAWMYGSGFPKSLDVSKAIDKAAGAERETKKFPARAATSGTMANGADTRPWIEKSREAGFHETAGDIPATPEAEKWSGWGTALKPAFEPVVVARKPVVGTVAGNVLEWGTGGLNIDGSRIVAKGDDLLELNRGNKRPVGENYDNQTAFKIQCQNRDTKSAAGRWPANVILDEHTAGLLDEQTGEDTSRFFYQAKASKRDRNEGLDELEAKRNGKMMRRANNTSEEPSAGFERFDTQPAKNFHPTVKPTALMRYLVKLVTPPGGTVLDPFTGSGSTGKAAILEGFDFVGVEVTEDYLPIIEGRLRWAVENRETDTLF